MRIAVTSDIHIDKNGEATLDALAAHIRSLAPDVLVVAGDVATAPTTLLSTFLALRPTAAEMVFVAGNHDVWAHPSLVERGQHSGWKLDVLLPALCREAGVHCLDAGLVQLGGVDFVGTLGWYDLSMRDPSLEAPPQAYETGEFAGLRWMDHVYATFLAEGGERRDIAGIAALLRERLRAQLAEASADRVVAVTHMVAFEAQLLRKDHPGWRFAQAFIGHRALGELQLADPRVVLSISGHTHHRSDLEIGGLRAVCAPLGYRREWGTESEVEAVRRSVRVVDL